MNRRHLLIPSLLLLLSAAATAEGGSTGPQLLDQFDYGHALATAGDVDGDGTPDVITGFVGYSSGGAVYNNGAAFVYSGATGALLHLFPGAATQDGAGWAVDGAGDVNGDGVPDLIVGAPNADPNGLLNAGSASVYSGADGSLLWQFDGVTVNGMFGQSVAGAGDVNADGYADLIVGDPQDSFWGGGPGAGVAWVYSGATGAPLWGYIGASADVMGWAVGAAGDYDGDGYDDLLVSAPGNTVGSNNNAGSVFVYSGAAHAVLLQIDGTADGYLGKSVARGDVDGDGAADFVIGAPSFNTASSGWQSTGAVFVYSDAGALLRQVDGQASFDEFGAAVAVVGDLDGDGAGEYLVAAPQSDSGGLLDNGSVELYSGASGSLMHRFEGASDYRKLGQDLASAGDLDGDAAPEFLIADPGNWSGGFHGSGDAWSWVTDPFLTLSQGQVSAAAGGAVDFLIDFPASEAGASYLLAGSATGAGPTTVSGVDVPLTSDWFTTLMTSGSPPAVFSNSAGALDAGGDAMATLDLPPGAAAAHIGATFWFAAVSYLPPGAVQLSSVAVTVSVNP